MVDQRLGESKRCPFLKDVMQLLTQLALKFKCKIIPIYLERVGDDEFKMEVLDPINLKKNDQTKMDKKMITIKINQIIENMIKRNPGQWIWTHGRWK